MKLLIAGSALPGALELFYKKYLDKMGVENILFDIHGEFYREYNKSKINKLLFRAGLSSIYPRLNAALLLQVEDFKPTHILFFKGMETFPATLKLLKKQGIHLSNYNPDNPFTFSGKGSGNKNLKKSIGLYDLHLTYNLEVKDKIEKDYKLPVAWLPFGYESDEILYQQCAAQTEIIKTCFLGNPDKMRAGFITELATAGIEIDVYGSSWNSFVSHKNIRIFNSVYNKDFYATLYKYRVQLNPLRMHNLNSHAMRSFEAPGIGGIILAPATTEHSFFYEEGTEAFFYTDMKECIRKIKYLLNLSADKAMTIRKSVRKKCLQAGYSYEARAKQLLEILEKS